MMDLIDDDLSSSDADSEDYSEDVGKIDIYRENILKSPLDYNSHFRLIKALKYSNQLVEARDAREAMNKYYPLSPELWIEWITDEKSINTDKDLVNSLFIRACYDYRSADVWFDYCSFTMGYLTDKSEIRQLFEQAISQVGTHLSKGYLIWGTYVLYETSQLQYCESISPDEVSEQRQKIYKLYSRQLALPLEGNEESLNEFLEWNENPEWKEEIKNQYEKGKKLLELYQPFEKKIEEVSIDYSANKSESDLESKEENWLKYLEFSEENQSKSEVINLYERSITELCLSQSIWMKYLQFLTKNFDNDSEKILTAYKRAVRNYSSSLQLWLDFTRCMEKYNCPPGEIRPIFDSIFRQNLIDLSPFLPLWRAYLDFEKRQLDKQLQNNAEPDLSIIRSIFDRLIVIDNYVYYDPDCQLLKYWAFIEARYGKNMAKSRELWAMVRKHLGNVKAALWLENFEFERRFGDFENLKRLANTVVNCSVDFPEFLFEKVLRYIAEDGDLESYLKFMRKIDFKLKKVSDRRSKEEVEKKENPVKNLKRKAYDLFSPEPKVKKEKRPQENIKESIKPKILPEPVKENPVEHCNEKSIFVSNLNYKVSENDLREKFEKCGKVTDIRMGKDSMGRSRGFAYIQFESVDDVENALKLEHDLLMERPMFVNRSNPDKRHSFQFPVGVTEKNKIFIKNLPKVVTKHALENIYKAYGTLKEVRLVTFKNGAPKGIAYVEFFNEDDASKAIVGTDGMFVGDKSIDVKLSNPPTKMSAVEESNQNVSSTFSPSTFIVPRAVQKPMMTQKKVIHGASSNSQDIVEPKKSNDDFRKFLI